MKNIYDKVVLEKTKIFLFHPLIIGKRKDNDSHVITCDATQIYLYRKSKLNTNKERILGKPYYTFHPQRRRKYC